MPSESGSRIGGQMTCTDYCDGCGDVTTVRLFNKSLYCGQCYPRCVICNAADIVWQDACVECAIQALIEQLPNGSGTDEESQSIFNEILAVRAMEAA